MLDGLLASVIGKIQNSAARRVVRSGRETEITSVIESLLWLPIRENHVYSSALDKALNNLVPPYTSDPLQPNEPARQLKPFTCNSLCVPKTNTKYSDGKLDVCARSLWNELHHSTRSFN